jgi:hypothetical protein
MATTTFTDNVTVIYASWLNDVNSCVYNGTFPNGVITTTSVNCTNLTATNATITYATLLFGNFTITPVGTKLVFSYLGTDIASLDSTGNFIALNSVKAPTTVAQTGITP